MFSLSSLILRFLSSRYSFSCSLIKKRDSFILPIFSFSLFILFSFSFSIRSFSSIHKFMIYCLVATCFPFGLLRIDSLSVTSLLTGPCSTDWSPTISLWSFMSSLLTGCLCWSAVTLWFFSAQTRICVETPITCH